MSDNTTNKPFVKAPLGLVETANLSASAKVLWLLLRSMCRDQQGRNVCWPSVQTLSRKTDLTKRLFSLCDAVCIVMGASLSDLGLPPGRVRSCIDAIVGAWNRIVEDIRLDPETLERADDRDFHHDWFLVAEDIPANGQLRFAVFEQDPWGHGRSGFVPRIVNGRDVYFRPTIGYPRPMIMLNVSQTVTLVLQHVFGLARELRSAGERF